MSKFCLQSAKKNRINIVRALCQINMVLLLSIIQKSILEIAFYFSHLNMYETWIHLWHFKIEQFNFKYHQQYNTKYSIVYVTKSLVVLLFLQLNPVLNAIMGGRTRHGGNLCSTAFPKIIRQGRVFESQKANRRLNLWSSSLAVLFACVSSFSKGCFLKQTEKFIQQSSEFIRC